jgi:Calcineurin-like phosphoesterase
MLLHPEPLSTNLAAAASGVAPAGVGGDNLSLPSITSPRVVMSERVIAIGDIHGCAAALGKIIELIAPEPDDTLVVLGDCVDRGPDSRRVIDQLLALRETCRVVPILGNHEEMMLNFLDGRPQPDEWLECGGATTVASYRGADGKPAPVQSTHVDFLRTWIDCFQTDTHFFAHASYEPERPLAEQHWQTMRWQSLRDVIPEQHESGKIAVVGHTSLKNGEIMDLGYLVCIDTYCWGGGWLTALEATTRQLWQVDRNGRVRS